MSPFNQQVVAITGGAQGIGAALGTSFSRAGARVALLDRDGQSLAETAAAIKAVATQVDVADERALATALADVEKQLGPIDILCSNAGILITDNPIREPISASNEDWQRVWEVNVLSHLYGARAVVPGMLARGKGYLLNTVSAAGLLSQIGSATYSTSKHAAIGFAESLAIAYRGRGIGVSVLCPQGVDTPMLRAHDGERLSGMDGILSAQDVADIALQGIVDQKFLILPHPQVESYMQNKTADYDRWLGGMRKLRDHTLADGE